MVNSSSFSLQLLAGVTSFLPIKKKTKLLVSGSFSSSEVYMKYVNPSTYAAFQLSLDWFQPLTHLTKGDLRRALLTFAPRTFQ